MCLSAPSRASISHIHWCTRWCSGRGVRQLGTGLASCSWKNSYATWTENSDRTAKSVHGIGLVQEHASPDHRIERAVLRCEFFKVSTLKDMLLTSAWRARFSAISIMADSCRSRSLVRWRQPTARPSSKRRQGRSPRPTPAFPRRYLRETAGVRSFDPQCWARSPLLLPSCTAIWKAWL